MLKNLNAISSKPKYPNTKKKNEILKTRKGFTCIKYRARADETLQGHSAHNTRFGDAFAKKAGPRFLAIFGGKVSMSEGGHRRTYVLSGSNYQLINEIVKRWLVAFVVGTGTMGQAVVSDAMRSKRPLIGRCAPHRGHSKTQTHVATSTGLWFSNLFKLFLLLVL